MAAEPPEQFPVQPEPVPLKGYTLRPRAEYRAHALVRGIRKYDTWLLLDRMGALIPWDAVLAWGPASVPETARRLEISQHGRWYWWRSHERLTSEQTRRYSESMANTHLIPANATISRRLAELETGQVVMLRGMLVDVYTPEDGRPVIKTSISRQDQGAGACEVLLVESLEIETAGKL